MTIDQLRALAEHATLRLSKGENAFVHVEGLPRPILVKEISVNEQDFTLDVLVHNGSSLYRIAPGRVVAVQLSK